MNIKGIHHIELTVTDLQRSKDFYSQILGFKIVANHPNFIMFFNKNFYLGIADHTDRNVRNKFNEFNIGLDHIAFEVPNKSDLEDAIKLFDDKRIAHGEIQKLSNNVLVLAFRDPDNIQLELSWKEKQI